MTMDAIRIRFLALAKILECLPDETLIIFRSPYKTTVHGSEHQRVVDVAKIMAKWLLKVTLTLIVVRFDLYLWTAFSFLQAMVRPKHLMPITITVVWPEAFGRLCILSTFHSLENNTAAWFQILNGKMSLVISTLGVGSEETYPLYKKCQDYLSFTSPISINTFVCEGDTQ